MVANEVLYRTDLSWKAKGIYAYLFSKPDGWDFSGDRIVNEGSDGRKVVFSALKELEKSNLLERRRQNDGRMEYIIKYSENPIDNRTEPLALFGKVPKVQSAEKGSISNKDGENNKDIALDEKRKENAEKSNKMISTYSFESYMNKMENDPRRSIQVIAFYFKKKGLRFDSLEKVQSAIKRHLRAAREVANFNDDEIVKAYRIADKEYPSMYTCETLHKILTR